MRYASSFPSLTWREFRLTHLKMRTGLYAGAAKEAASSAKGRETQLLLLEPL